MILITAEEKQVLVESIATFKSATDEMMARKEPPSVTEMAFFCGHADQIVNALAVPLDILVRTLGPKR